MKANLVQQPKKPTKEKNPMGANVRVAQDVGDTLVVREQQGDAGADGGKFVPAQLGNWSREKDPERERLLQVVLD